MNFIINCAFEFCCSCLCSFTFCNMQQIKILNCIFQLANCSQVPQPTSPYALLSINIICRLRATFHLPRKCFFEALLFKLFQNMHTSKLRLFPSKILSSCFKDTKMTTFTTKWYPLSLWLTSSMQNARWLILSKHLPCKTQDDAHLCEPPQKSLHPHNPPMNPIP